jgi:hypothetical protein
MLIIAVDPADDGAAVLLASPEAGLPAVVSACAWRVVKRDGEPAWALSWYGVRGGFEDFRTPGQIGREIGRRLVPFDRDPPVAPARVRGLVIEAPYVGRNPHTALRIARFGGLVAGGIQAALAETEGQIDDVPVAYEVQPNVWRAILGLSAPSREEAKARSLAGVPSLLPSIRPALERLGRLDHVTDAGGIGLIGSMFRAWEPGFDERLEAASRPRARRVKRGA